MLSFPCTGVVAVSEYVGHQANPAQDRREGDRVWIGSAACGSHAAHACLGMMLARLDFHVVSCPHRGLGSEMFLADSPLAISLSADSQPKPASCAAYV